MVLQCIKAFVRDSKAVSAIEYAILVGIIVVALGAALTTFSGTLTTAITDVGTDVTAVNTNRPAPPN